MTDNERYLLMKRQKEIERKCREQQQQEECDCESDNCGVENYGEISSGRRNDRTKYEPIRGGGIDVKLDVGDKKSKYGKVSSKLVSHEYLPFATTKGKCIDYGDGIITGEKTSNGI